MLLSSLPDSLRVDTVRGSVLGFTYSLELAARVSDWVILPISLANSASSLALLLAVTTSWPWLGTFSLKVSLDHLPHCTLVQSGVIILGLLSGPSVLRACCPEFVSFLATITAANIAPRAWLCYLHFQSVDFGWVPFTCS